MNSTERFSSRVEDYVKYRPHYPTQIIQYFDATIGLGETWVIADIGSGTGISSELFLKNGNKVLGVEPNKEMRTAAEKLLYGYDNFVSLEGTAEKTNLSENSVDLIVAGQAFHWFDPDASKTEFKRIVKPDGYVVLIWNERQVTSPFEVDYENLLNTFGTDYHKIDHRNITPDRIGLFFHPQPFETVTFPNTQIFDFDGVKGRLLSSSYAPGQADPNFEPMISLLTKIFNAHEQDGKVMFTYKTLVYYGKIK